ncbi:segregation/condensation protein A [Candidatus Pacearchaeota archaeon]|jgi:segregation and condensation protein A|nr:segregation/condensation protein A [Candidatus Pacearchaeota archaeon]
MKPDEEPKIMEEYQKSSVGQDQIHDLLFNREIGWQEIIYDLINTEQLDPWNIDIIILSDKYLDKIKEFEEADFFVSSKVLLAASLLLRIKSEILLNRYIKSIDEILFGKKESIKVQLERIELNEDIPELIPRSPMPRFRKVSLKELMESLNKAIVTENRRIKKEIVSKNTLRESSFSLPKRKFSIKDKIKEIYRDLTDWFKEKKEDKITFENFAKNKEEKIISFLPLLYLEDQKKIWLDQKNPFEDINIWLREVFFEKNEDPFAELRKEAEEFEKNFKEELSDIPEEISDEES